MRLLSSLFPIFITCILTTNIGFSQDAAPLSVKQNKPIIEAQDFDIVFKKNSRSGRILLFEDAQNYSPKPGKILLIKQGQDDVAAVRVLKNYEKKFAARLVIPYKELSKDQKYRAILKVSDKITHFVREREKRASDLDKKKTDEDLSKEISPDDAELDRGITGKKPEKLFTPDGEETSAQITPETLDIEGDNQTEAEIVPQDIVPTEIYPHSVSAEYGLLRNFDRSGNYTRYTGFGARYSYHFWKMPFIKKSSIQDMFSAEFSAFFYSISGFQKPNDEITVLPFIATVRYHLFLGETFSFFGYFGMMKNFVSFDPAVSDQAAILSTTNPVAGIGMFMKIASSWALRLEYGTDLFGAGAVLKF